MLKRNMELDRKLDSPAALEQQGALRGSQKKIECVAFRRGPDRLGAGGRVERLLRRLLDHADRAVDCIGDVRRDSALTPVNSDREESDQPITRVRDVRRPRGAGPFFIYREEIPISSQAGGGANSRRGLLAGTTTKATCLLDLSTLVAFRAIDALVVAPSEALSADRFRLPVTIALVASIRQCVPSSEWKEVLQQRLRHPYS